MDSGKRAGLPSDVAAKMKVGSGVFTDDVTDRLHATSTGWDHTKAVPRDLAETVLFTIAASHEVDEAIVGQLRDRKLTRVWQNPIQISVIPDCCVASYGLVASARNQQPAVADEQIVRGRYRQIG